MKPPLGFYVHSRGTPSRDPGVPEVPGPALPVVAVIPPLPGREANYEPAVDFLVVGFLHGSFARLPGFQARFCSGPGCRFCAASGGQPPEGFELEAVR